MRGRLVSTLLTGLFTLAALAWSSPGEARSSIALSLSKERVGLRDSLVVEVRVVSEGDDLGEVDLALGGNFALINRRHKRSLSFVNGQTSSETTYTYRVQPIRSGIFDVGPASVWSGTGELFSNTARVEVVPGAVVERSRPGPGPSAQGQATPSRRGPRTVFDDPWDPFGESKERGRRREGGDGEVKLLATVDATKVVVGGRINYRLRLLTKGAQPSGVKPRSESSFDGFWVEPLDIPERPKASTYKHGGKTYDAYLLKRLALFPTGQGKLTIEPAIWDVTVVVPDFLLATTRKLVRSTQPISIEILPLPADGQPEGFSGAVGDFTISAEIDKTSAEVNEALLLTVRLSGTGNLNNAPAPELPPLSDFKLYSSKASPPQAATGGRLATSRTWEFVLVAKAAGEKQIPAITYTFFDPKSAQYRVATSEGQAIRVEKGDEARVGVVLIKPGAQGAQSGVVEAVRREIAYLKLVAPELAESRTPLHRRPLVRYLLVMPVLLNVFGLVLLWTRSREPGDPAKLRSRGAYKNAKQKLKEAGHASRKGDGGAVATLVEEALTGYLADRLNEPRVGLTRSRIVEALGSPERSDPILRLLDRVDYVRFTPQSGKDEKLTRLVKEAALRLKGLESGPKLGAAS